MTWNQQVDGSSCKECFLISPGSRVPKVARNSLGKLNDLCSEVMHCFLMVLRASENLDGV